MCVWYSKNRLNLFYQLELWAIWPTGLPVWLNLKLSISLFFYQFFQTLVLQRPPRNKHRSYMVCAFIVQVIHKNCRDLLKRSLKSVTLLSVCQSWVQPPSVQVIFVVKFLNRSLSFSVRFIDVQYTMREVIHLV